MQRKWVSILAGGAMLFSATGSRFRSGRERWVQHRRVALLRAAQPPKLRLLHLQLLRRRKWRLALRLALLRLRDFRTRR